MWKKEQYTTKNKPEKQGLQDGNNNLQYLPCQDIFPNKIECLELLKQQYNVFKISQIPQYIVTVKYLIIYSVFK